MKYTNITDKDVVVTNPESTTIVSRTPPVSISGLNIQSVTDDETEDTEDVNDENPILQAPTNLAIESLTPRISEDGSLVIDAIISFDSVSGADEYEVRLTKQ